MELLIPRGQNFPGRDIFVAKIEQHVASVNDDLDTQNLKAFRKFEIFFLQRKKSAASGIELG